MVRLRVLNGSRAGTDHALCRFPCTVGRAATDNLQLAEPGVWDSHLQLDRRASEGFLLTRTGQGRASVNGTEFDQVRLHNGDLIALGAVKLQFWLADVHQPEHRLAETLTWIGLGCLVLLEAVLLGWLA